MKTPLIKLLHELSDADVDRSYIREVLVKIIQDRGIEDYAVSELREKFKYELSEYGSQIEEDKFLNLSRVEI